MDELSFDQLRRRSPNTHLLKASRFARLAEDSQNRSVLVLSGIDANDLGWEDRYAFVAEDREFLKIADEIRRKLASLEPTMRTAQCLQARVRCP